MIPIDRRTLFGWLGLAAAPLPVASIAAPRRAAAEPVDMYGHRPAYAEPIGYVQPETMGHLDPLDHL